MTNNKETSSDTLVSDDVLLDYHKRITNILYKTVPCKDYSMIEDYAQDCMIFLINELNKNPLKTFNNSYLRSVVVKICVDSLRSKASSVKYFCTVCNEFFPRKERALACCASSKEELDGPKFNVGKYEACFGIFTNPKYKHYEASMITSPATSVENNDFLASFTSYLDNEEKTILFMLLDGYKVSLIAKRMNLKLPLVYKTIYYFRAVYFYLKVRGLI